MTEIEQVLAGEKEGCVVKGDVLSLLPTLPEKCVDLVFGSPPYEDCRTYGIDFALQGQAWVDWMVQVYRESLRACKGLVAFVVEGKTRKFRWSATPALLMADLIRSGVTLRKPPAFVRHGIPGSGGPDWWRNDYEFVICATNGGKLPWSESLACGVPCRNPTGGAFSYRTVDGQRINAQKHNRGSEEWKRNGSGEHRKGRPEITNPGNVIHCLVGGEHMGSRLAHENEAPFPEKLAERFVRSFCRPGGIVLDCFSGSGTTAATAIKCGRRYVAIDLRENQVELTRQRIDEVHSGKFVDRCLPAEEARTGQMGLFEGLHEKI